MYSSANAQRGYFQYQQNEVLSISKTEIIDRLLKALCSNIDSAILAMKENNIAKKGEKISKAIAIAGELRASLDFEKGGDIAKQLDSIYDFIIRELLFGNIKNDIDKLIAAKKTIIPIMEAWTSIVEKEKKGQNHPKNNKRVLKKLGVSI